MDRFRFRSNYYNLYSNTIHLTIVGKKTVTMWSVHLLTPLSRCQLLMDTFKASLFFLLIGFFTFKTDSNWPALQNRGLSPAE